MPFSRLFLSDFLYSLYTFPHKLDYDVHDDFGVTVAYFQDAYTWYENKSALESIGSYYIDKFYNLCIFTQGMFTWRKKCPNGLECW